MSRAASGSWWRRPFFLAVVELCGSSWALDDILVNLLSPQGLLDERSRDGEIHLRHPWPVFDATAPEQAIRSDGEPPDVSTRDAALINVQLAPQALPAGVEAAIYIGVFSTSFTMPKATVEQWLAEGSTPPPHNPLRFMTLLTHQYSDRLIRPDDLGDACIGQAFRAEICARSLTCLNVRGSPHGGGDWSVALPSLGASTYRVEAFLGEPRETCKDGPNGEAFFIPPIGQHVVSVNTGQAIHAAYLEFRVLFVDRINWWWANLAKVDPVTSWTEMMFSAVDLACDSPAANPLQYNMQPLDVAPKGLWLEFGVGSGRSTSAIAWRMKSRFSGDDPILHGFDSFQGLPVSWTHTKLGVGTFSMHGKVPEHLEDTQNVQIHVGLFTDTLSDLDVFDAAPVAFAHVDVDIYPSAVQVLARIACQLYPGSVVVFDELVNYLHFQSLGEYRAWEYIAAKYDIRWQYIGFFWQQAVPIIITERGSRC